MKRPQVNIAPVKRVARIFVGLAGTIGGLVLLGAADAVAAVVLQRNA